MSINQRHAVGQFGKILMSEVRDDSIDDSIASLRGEVREYDNKLADKLFARLSPQQRDVILRYTVGATDASLISFMKMLETQNDKYMLAYKTGDDVIDMSKMDGGLAQQFKSAIKEYSKHPDRIETGPDEKIGWRDILPRILGLR